jgi:RNA polymerase sigma factor (TIGR02999 family)
MSDVTCILSQIESGDPQAAARLLPLVYDELRKLAAQKMAQERPGQTLEATALVHEAYLRLVANSQGVGQHFQSEGHFFAAAAEAMRRILVDNARRKASGKHGGKLARRILDPEQIAFPERADDLLALDEALNRLQEVDPDVAGLVRLRYFAGMTIRQAAFALGVAPRTADAHWAYAKAWLLRELKK